jgi:hypothetical protein
MLLVLVACTVVQPIPPARDDLRFPAAPRVPQPEACRSAGAGARDCLVPAVPLEGYFGNLGTQIWNTDLQRSEYTRLAAEKTNLGSLYNAMLWPVGVYVGARSLASPSPSLVRDAAAFALAAYGVLSAGVPDRDRLYLEASRQLACAITFAAPSLYARPDILEGQEGFSALRSLPPGHASLAQTAGSLTLARKEYAQGFTVTLAALRARKPPGAAPATDVDARFARLKGGGGGTAASGAATIQLFAEHGRAQQALAQTLSGQLASLHTHLQVDAAGRLQERSNRIHDRLSAALIARAPALSEPGATLGQVMDLFGKAVKAAGAPAGSASAAGKAKGEGGAVPWEVNEKTLAGLTKDSADALVAFEVGKQGTLNAAIAAAQAWLAQHQARVDDARTVAARSSCTETLLDGSGALTLSDAAAGSGGGR